MQSFKLDKVITGGSTYYTESDTVLVINKIGTDADERVTFKVEGVPCAEFITDMGPLAPAAANRLRPFDLGENYIVVPPDKTFTCSEVGTDSIRIVGSILRLAPGEVTPAGFLARYTEQGKKYIDYEQAALGSDKAVAAYSAIDLLTKTCPTGEKWVFNNLFMARIETAASSIDYDLTLRFLLQDAPLDNLITSKLVLGITQYATPYPPNDTDLATEPFTFKDKPIELKPGQILKVQLFNTSAASITADELGKALIVGVKEFL